MKREQLFHLTVLLLCAGIYLVFALSSIDQPISYDEVRNVAPARSLAGESSQPQIGPDAVWSRPFYIGLLAALTRISHDEAALRLIGVVCTLLTLVLLYQFALIMSTGGAAQRRLLPGLAALLFVTNPAVIQGSLLVDTDPTTLMLFVTLFVLYLARELAANRKPSPIMLSLLFGLTLCWKITTPWLLALAMAAFLFWFHSPRLELRRVVAATSGGLLVFSLVWLAFSSAWAIPLSAPADYFRSGWSGYMQPGASSVTADLSAMALTVARLLLWGSPYFMLAAGVVLLQIARTESERHRAVVGFPAICAIVFLIGTLWLGGTPFGFPKYQMPVMPLLALLVAYGIAANLPVERLKASLTKVGWLPLCGAGALGLLYFYLLAADPLLTLNYELREALATRPEQLTPVAVRLVLVALVYLAFLPAAAALIRRVTQWPLRQAVAAALLIGMVTANLALDVRQAKADYLTRYGYGATGTEELIGYLRANVGPGDQLLATRELLFYYLPGDFADVPGSVWSDPETFHARLQDPQLRWVVYSIGQHEIGHFRKVFHAPSVRALLEGAFTPTQIGSYTVWERTIPWTMR